MSTEAISVPVLPSRVSFTVSFSSSGTAVMPPTRLPSTASAASFAFVAASLAAAAAACATPAFSFAAAAALPAALVASAALVAALFAFVAAALAVAAASVAGLPSRVSGALTSSVPRNAGRLLMLSSEVTSVSSFTPWLSALIAFRMSFLSSVFSDSVSAISYSSFFYCCQSL